MNNARPYRSLLRQQQVAQTRAAVLAAARALFARDGYATTTISQIASTAGVSPQTVYAAFASKAGVALALVDYTNEQSGVAELAKEVFAAQTARGILGASVHLVCVLHERIGDFIRVITEAAKVDKMLEPALAAGRASHSGPQRGLAERLSRMGALRPDVSIETAATLLTVWTSPELVERLVTDHQWSYDQIEEHLTSALIRALCVPAEAPR